MNIVLSKLRATITLLGAGMVLLLAVGSAGAASICLYAGEFDKTLPDGSSVRMWGYGEEVDCDFGTIDAVVSSPGPEIRIVDTSLAVTLFNGLAEPTSLLIHGQQMAAGSTPTWTDDATGGRTTTTQRVRSFTFETAPGASQTYTFNNLRPGTYLYQSASHPAVQVQMGLLGALVNDAAANQAYPAAGAYTADAVLVFSEIDPVLHEAVQTGTYGDPGQVVPSTGEPMTSTIDYQPKYFMINGEPYTAGRAPIDLGALAASDVVLLRFVNAALDNLAPTIPGQPLEAIAEGGYPYPFSRMRNSLDLPAGQTMDAQFTVAGDAYLAVFDRRLHLSNAGEEFGGYLAFLQIGAAAQTLNVAVTGTGSGSVTAVGAPGGIDCPGTCAAAYLAGTEVNLQASEGHNSLFTGWSGDCTGTGDCLVTMDAAKSVTANFDPLFPTGTGVLVRSPNGGESLKAGDIAAIEWAASDNADNFALAYSLNNGLTWTTIAEGVTGNRRFWVVPVPTRSTDKALVRVTAFDGGGAQLAQDRSDATFEVLTVKLTAPNGGETLVSGDTFTVTWETYATLLPVNRVQLQYSLNGRTGWKKIADIRNDNPGSFDWTIPDQRGTTSYPDAKVRITIRNGTRILGQDLSDLPFTLADPTSVP